MYICNTSYLLNGLGKNEYHEILLPFHLMVISSNFVFMSSLVFVSQVAARKAAVSWSITYLFFHSEMSWKCSILVASKLSWSYKSCKPSPRYEWISGYVEFHFFQWDNTSSNKEWIYLKSVEVVFHLFLISLVNISISSLSAAAIKLMITMR